ncbi:MAG: HAMP domain-containing histidine kinase [Candidatus Zixiibacteriota bacterium]|nr:MAG: HAMP domain-containing histidine kinase [candidate division Zixibacteria bacterium]
MTRILTAALVIILMFLLPDCSGNRESGQVITVESVDDPLLLRYRFQVEDKLVSPYPDCVLPIDIYGDDRLGAVVFGDMWRPPDTLSCIIFYADMDRHQAIHHFNIKASHLNSPFILDCDRDGLQEVAVTYVVRDSLWLDIYHFDSGSIYRKFIATGEDRDDNGYWDGCGAVCLTHDFNGDGYDELLVNCDTGYDLYPRELYCIDWFNDSTRWKYSYAGIPNRDNMFVEHVEPDSCTYLILGIGSKGNAAIARDMDDSHSYLIVLDGDGNELWKKETGAAFSKGAPVIIDYDSDGFFDILVGHNSKREITASGIAAVENTMLKVYNRNGRQLDSVILGPELKIDDASLIDINADSIGEIALALADHTIRIFNQRLDNLGTYLFAAKAGIWDHGDFLNAGDNQLLINVHGTKLLLTTSEFEPLAMFEAEDPLQRGSYAVTYHGQHKDSCLIFITAGMGDASYTLSLKKTPWYTVFSRQPILAFLAAFIPLSIVIGIIWLILTKFRQKNLIIGQQRDQLNAALTELKEAQEKLVAAEKYKQAREIAGGVAHEIHNALYPASSSLFKLKQRIELTDQDAVTRNRALVDLSEKAVARALSMVELVTVYSRLESEKKRDKVNIQKILEEIIEANKPEIERLKVTFVVEISGTVFINCYRPHAYSMLNNLVVNALQALGEAERRTISVTAADNDKKTIIEVADTGPGIADEHMPRIFDTFFSTRPSSGTGLGLSIVKKIVELYNGEISVKSCLDKGTKFIILLPSS